MGLCVSSPVAVSSTDVAPSRRSIAPGVAATIRHLNRQLRRIRRRNESSLESTDIKVVCDALTQSGHSTDVCHLACELLDFACGGPSSARRKLCVANEMRDRQLTQLARALHQASSTHDDDRDVNLAVLRACRSVSSAIWGASLRFDAALCAIVSSALTLFPDTDEFERLAVDVLKQCDVSVSLTVGVDYALSRLNPRHGLGVLHRLQSIVCYAAAVRDSRHSDAHVSALTLVVRAALEAMEGYKHDRDCATCALKVIRAVVGLPSGLRRTAYRAVTVARVFGSAAGTIDSDAAPLWVPDAALALRMINDIIDTLRRHQAPAFCLPFAHYAVDVLTSLSVRALAGGNDTVPVRVLALLPALVVDCLSIGDVDVAEQCWRFVLRDCGWRSGVSVTALLGIADVTVGQLRRLAPQRRVAAMAVRCVCYIVTAVLLQSHDLPTSTIPVPALRVRHNGSHAPSQVRVSPVWNRARHGLQGSSGGGGLHDRRAMYVRATPPSMQRQASGVSQRVGSSSRDVDAAELHRDPLSESQAGFHLSAAAASHGGSDVSYCYQWLITRRDDIVDGIVAVLALTSGSGYGDQLDDADMEWVCHCGGGGSYSCDDVLALLSVNDFQRRKLLLLENARLQRWAANGLRRVWVKLVFQWSTLD